MIFGNIENLNNSSFSLNDPKKKIELLAPAGDLQRLKTAVLFGADAVYCGLPEWSLRSSREINFTLKTIKEGINFAHKYNKKVYLTFNIFPHEQRFKKLEQDFKKISAIPEHADAMIVSDIGVLSLVKKYLPSMPIHISTQVNTLNSEAIKMWQRLGAKRIVLARELTLKEIRQIKNEVKDIELEVFGHGAMCIAYSGRCLLSKYFANREANLGDCAQSCRWEYKIKTQNAKLQPLISQSLNLSISQSPVFYLEEKTRPGELIQIQENESGTYFLNSKEICTIRILDKFINSGIDSLKIEGRAKSLYYLAIVVKTYRTAIDCFYEGKKNPQEFFEELNMLTNRGYSYGFLLGRHNYEQEYDFSKFEPPVVFVGVVIRSKKNKLQVEVKNKFSTGEEIEIITPHKNHKTKILNILDNKKQSVNTAVTNPQNKFWIEVDSYNSIPVGSVIRKKT